MVNVSVDLFGNSVNLIELGGRVQGVEKIVERFFGPEGYFSKKNTQELIESKRQTAANYISSFDSMVRAKSTNISLCVKLSIIRALHELYNPSLSNPS